MRRIFVPLMLCLLVIAACGRGTIDPEARAQRLGSQLRCPVCRGVPIAASPSDLAQEMMGIVRQQIASGKSDEEILRYFEERYGEWALLSPKPEGANLLVWILPILFLVGGAGFIILHLKRRPPDKENL